MPTPANRAKIQLVRGSYSNIAASIADLVDGELCYAKDENVLYMVEGSTLTALEYLANTDVTEAVEDAIGAALSGGTGITVTYDDPAGTLVVDLDDTAVTPGTYGSSTSIPAITIDQQGRITAASSSSISTDLEVAADSGTNETITLGSETLTISGDTGITTTTTTNGVSIDLDDTAVTPGSYGSSTEIPTFTVDQQGRLTAAGSASISTDLEVAADTGTNETITLGSETLTISGDTGITTSTTTNGVSIDLDDTAVTPGTYGSSETVPVITVDQQGRITAASEVLAPPVLVEVHNQTASDIAKGKPVYVSGTHSSGKPTIELADNDGSGTYPAIGLVYDTITAGTDGYVIISGLLSNVATGTYTAGQALYLDSTPGDLTVTRPTASTEKVQKVGLVTRSHASNGSILIIGAGRTNDINNELVALTGVALNDSDLGTFTGSIITDNVDIKTALQELETEVDLDQASSSSGNFTVGADLLGPSTFNIDPATHGDDTGLVVIKGNLQVNGITTTIDSETLIVEDKNIELGNVASPSDSTADGGGITLLGSTNKTISWIDSTDAWTFSEHIDIASGKEYYINGTSVLNATTLGSSVVNSSLTSVGTIGTGTWQGTEIGVAYGGTGLTTVAQGTVLVANASNTITALDGGGVSDGYLFYDSATDTISWVTEIDGGTY